MSQKKTGFVSEIDQFLSVYDKRHPELSKTQLSERTKALRVALMRDQPIAAPNHLIPDWFDKNE